MRIAINGFGRIGRMLYKLATGQGLEVVAINDLMDSETLVHLLKYDSVHGRFNRPVQLQGDSLVCGGLHTVLLREPEILKLPWKAMGVDVVVECTGRHLTEDTAGLHLAAGAGQVILSAPAADNTIPMYVCGVSDKKIMSAPIFSNASCTTNNVAMLIKVLHEGWGVKEGYITTVHSNTLDQNLHDAAHRDLRRARAASASIIPTSTGAAKAITHIFPELADKLGGAGIRVPVLNGSLTDLTCLLDKPATVHEINNAFAKYARGELKGVLEYTEDPIVSIDVVGNTHSCIFDSKLTSIVGDMVKVVGWYDNEMGYSSRLADILELLAGSGNQ